MFPKMTNYLGSYAAFNVFFIAMKSEFDDFIVDVGIRSNPLSP